MARTRTPNTNHAKPKAVDPPKKNSVKDVPTVGSKSTERVSSKKDVKGKGKAKDAGPLTKGNLDGGMDQLKAEILALGGDEADFELVKDVDSDVDSAGEGSRKADVCRMPAELTFCVK